MKTLVGLVVIVVFVALVRSALRSPPRSAVPLPPPVPRSGVRAPAVPRLPSASGRETEFPPEKADDAFAVGFIMGREFGHHDEPRTPAYIEDTHDTYVGDDDWGGGWGDDGGGDE